MLAILRPAKLASSPSDTPPTTAVVEVVALEPTGKPVKRNTGQIILVRLRSWHSTAPRLVPPKLSNAPVTGRRARLGQRQRDKEDVIAAQAVLNLIMAKPTTTKATAKREGKAKTAELKRLKSRLARPAEARRLVGALKLIPAETVEHQHAVRGVCIDCEEVMTSETNGKPTKTKTFDLLAKLPSAGGVLGQAVQTTGAFDMLASTSGGLVAASHGHEGISPPVDRFSVLLYWWGFEIVLPPPAIDKLDTAHDVSSAAFAFLSALVMGGAPELAPFIRYLSLFIDTEWKAIRAQNKGHGVIMAATWILPLVIVPRPWDFPL